MQSGGWRSCSRWGLWPGSHTLFPAAADRQRPRHGRRYLSLRRLGLMCALHGARVCGEAEGGGQPRGRWMSWHGSRHVQVAKLPSNNTLRRRRRRRRSCAWYSLSGIPGWSRNSWEALLNQGAHGELCSHDHHIALTRYFAGICSRHYLPHN